MLKVGQIINGTCVDLSSEGKGIIKHQGDVIFCDGLFLDEVADVEIQYARAKVYYGKIKKIHNISKYRIQPKCPVCSSCGGCQFQQLDYSQQLIFKQKRVQEALKRIGGISFKIDPVVGMENPYFYRNKAQIPFGFDKKHKIVYGMFKQNTHDIVPIKQCYIEDEKSALILSNIKDLMIKHKIEPYDEDKRTGIIRHVLIRTSYHYEQIMVVLITSKLNFPGQNNFVKDLIKSCPNITTVVENVNERKTNVILGEKEKVLYGKGYINDDILGVKFNISASSFFQVNPIQTQKLYSLAIDGLNLKGDEIVLDAYAGVGTLGLITSKKAKEVISVEIVKSAHMDGIKNAKNNNINNVRFVLGDAGEYIAKSDISFDAVIMDPPRKGSDERFLQTLINNKVKKISYVSCNPETLARDLKYLSPYYEIAKITPVDMFPMTSHVETVVVLFFKK